MNRPNTIIVEDAIEKAKTVESILTAGERDHLAQAICDNLSPEAVAAIAFCIPHLETADDVNAEMRWFRDMLLETVGGFARAKAIVDQLGL